VRVPVSWLSEYVDVPASVDELADVLTMGGHEVEAVEQPTGGTRGVRVAEVLGVARIAGSDKLHLVQVTDGEATHEIVCGASNYAPGDKVAAALPGATLRGELEIGRRQLFGHTSNGMLASAKELGVGDDHAGIWVLDHDAPLGADVAEWLDLDEAVLVIEVTPDRGYGLSLHGLARDLAALTGAELRLPGAGTPPAGGDVVPVTITDPDRCRRFDARLIRGVRVGPSPARLQRRLVAAGIRPVSNVVDATNAALLETGNPIHAYDLALLAGPAIEVRTARSGESLVTLDGVERALDPDDLLICDAGGPVALAGVMGGEATQIGAGTIDVLLEVANFTSRTVLRTARRHQLHTEGSKRWERQVPPEAVPVAAARCAGLIIELAGGAVTGGADHYPTPVERPVIRLRTDRARARLGLDLDAAAQGALLESIACRVAPETADLLVVTPPAYRPDLLAEVDLQEEIVRLHGFDRVPARVPSTGQVGGRSAAHEARRAVRRALAGGGWTEVMPYPFVAETDVDLLGLPPGDRRNRTLALVNPLSKEEAVLRSTLLPGLLRVVRRNVNRQLGDVAVFEVGHVFLPPTPDEPAADGGPDGTTLPAEPQRLGLVATGAFEAGRHDRPARAADLYDLLGACELVREVLGLAAFEVTATDEAPLHPGRAARLRLDGVDIGVVGELHPRVAGAFEVPARTLVGELRLDPLIAPGIRPRQAVVPSTLPPVAFDVAVVVDESVPAAAVEAAVRAGAGPRLASCALFDEFRGAQLGEGRKSLAYRLRLSDPDTQLRDTDEAAAIDAVARAVAERVGGHLRR
jgi:phenylalanyl-tRNA synthetase beta chain